MSRLLTEEEVIAKSKRNREARRSIIKLSDGSSVEVIGPVTMVATGGGGSGNWVGPPKTIKEKKVAANRANKPKVVSVRIKKPESCKYGCPPKQTCDWCAAKIMRISTKPKPPSEHAEQCKVIEWCDKHPLACMIHATPNGLRTSIRAAIKAKKEGLRKGYPDLSLDVARNGFHGLRIELKRLRRSNTSEEQDDWIDFLRSQGYKAEICRGADDAIKTIQEYLQEPIDP